MKKTLLGLCTLSLLTACSGPAIKDTAIIQQAAISQAKNSEQDPKQAIESSRNLQVKAQQEDLYVFSPSYMAQAEKEIALAEESLKQGKPASETIAHSLAANALFERGLATKETVINQLKPSFDGVDMLKEINSHVLVKDDFEDIEDDIKDLIILIEQGKTNDALKDQQDVLADITQLEIETLKVSYFTPAEEALEKAEDADAEEFAAKTYETAEVAVEKLELLIESKYKERQLIAEQSLHTIHLAQHAENVAKVAQPLIKLNAEQAEQHVLYIESLLDRVTKALNHNDIQHMPLDNQSIALAQAVETLSKQLQAKQDSEQWKAEKQTLEDKIAELKKQLEQTTPASIEAEVVKPETNDASESEPQSENSAMKDMAAETEAEQTVIKETELPASDEAQVPSSETQSSTPESKN